MDEEPRGGTMKMEVLGSCTLRSTGEQAGCPYGPRRPSGHRGGERAGRPDVDAVAEVPNPRALICDNEPMQLRLLGIGKAHVRGQLSTLCQYRFPKTHTASCETVGVQSCSFEAGNKPRRRRQRDRTEEEPDASSSASSTDPSPRYPGGGTEAASPLRRINEASALASSPPTPRP